MKLSDAQRFSLFESAYAGITAAPRKDWPTTANPKRDPSDPAGKRFLPPKVVGPELGAAIAAQAAMRAAVWVLEREDEPAPEHLAAAPAAGGEPIDPEHPFG